jgi:arylformamidase
MRYIDITREIKEGMPVYPGNPEPEIERYREIPEDSTTESRICMGSHTGTHVDAPEHVIENAGTADEIPLERFHGECQVLGMRGEDSVTREMLENKDIEEDIVLLRTDNSLRNFEEFDKSFVHLELEAVEYLIDRGVKTIGIDYLSLVEFDGGEEAEEAHAVANRHMTVIEGLDLEDASPGRYTFAGFPLKIAFDGSPLRAVLIDH